MRNRETEAATGTQRIEIGNSALPDVINLVLPESIRNHPLVWDKWFYTLPTAVWDSLCDALGRDCFDADALDLEIAASRHAEATQGCVGFHNGLPFSDFYLRPLPPIDFSHPTFAAYIEEWRAAGHKVPTSSGQITERLEALKMPQQAYLGWLLTCPSFLTELQGLRTHFPDVFDRSQSPPTPIQFSTNSNANDSPQFLQSNNDSSSQAVRAFCRRWRISRIVAPVTFLPLSIQFPVALPVRSAIDAQSSGSLIFIPDITPIPNRDLLEQMAQEVVQQTIQHEVHLAEWFKLAHSEKLARKTLNQYAKMYELQHFIRILYARHGDRLDRQQEKIFKTIGEYLGLTSNQMKLDMKRIRERLKNDWLTAESLFVLHR